MSGIPKLADAAGYWRSHLKAWRESGMSQARYCAEHNLKPFNFSYWKKKLEQSAGGSFVEARMGQLRTAANELPAQHVRRITSIVAAIGTIDQFDGSQQSRDRVEAAIERIPGVDQNLIRAELRLARSAVSVASGAEQLPAVGSMGSAASDAAGRPGGHIEP